MDDLIDFNHEIDTPVFGKSFLRGNLRHVVDQSGLSEIVNARVSSLTPSRRAFHYTGVQDESKLHKVERVLFVA